MDKQLETLVLDIERGLYEETPNGSIVTAHGKPYGVYFDKINDGPWQATRNTLTIEGINYWLETAMRGGTADSTFFIALYNGAVTPSSSWTGANFSATASEITSAGRHSSMCSRSPSTSPPAPGIGEMARIPPDTGSAWMIMRGPPPSFAARAHRDVRRTLAPTGQRLKDDKRGRPPRDRFRCRSLATCSSPRRCHGECAHALTA